MKIIEKGLARNELQEELLPVKTIERCGIETIEGHTGFKGEGSYVVLDFGRELCGGIRLVVKHAQCMVKWRLTFGESLTEAYSSIGEKNATNDHSPRDFEVITGPTSDSYFGQTGFRYVRVELLTEIPVIVQDIFAVSLLPVFEREAEIITNDAQLNEIIKTAAYTLKLNFQNGYIWDGIKRDRLVWSGDLHPEIITSLYLFGDNENITNSLSFLRERAGEDAWINGIPSYSAWWLINLCDYCKITGNWEYFLENRDYALKIIERFYECLQEDGEVLLTGGIEGMEYYLDWSTFETLDAKIGVQALIILMAQKFDAIEANEKCKAIVKQVSCCLKVETKEKPVRAFQVLAGRDNTEDDLNMLQKNGAKGFSTFMAYYILTAIAKSGGNSMLELLKTYYGGMLSRGATTFWEDFDVDWLENSCRIDESPKAGQKDIHGDFGKHCYTQFRHSLCHGWSSGVVAFVVEYILGIQIEDGGKRIHVNPHLLGLTDIEAKLPLEQGMLEITIHHDDIQLNLPKGCVLQTL